MPLSPCNCLRCVFSALFRYMWLEEDLASIDRAKTPWIFVNLHAPWYVHERAFTPRGLEGQ